MHVQVLLLAFLVVFTDADTITYDVEGDIVTPAGQTCLSETSGFLSRASPANCMTLLLTKDANTETFTFHEKVSGDPVVISSTNIAVVDGGTATKFQFSTGSALVTEIDDLIDSNNPFLIIKENEGPTTPANCLAQSGQYSVCHPTNDLVYFDPSDCTDGNCERCIPDIDTCNICKDGYSVVGSTCVECDDASNYGTDCLTCDNTECLSCGNSKVLGDEMSTTACGDCVTVYGADCATCDDDKCLTCDNDKVLGDETSGSACGDCVTVYGADCATCDDDKCLTCDNNKVLDDETSDSACEDCVTVYGADCATCDDDKCLTCDNDKVLGDETSDSACQEPEAENGASEWSRSGLICLMLVSVFCDLMMQK